MSLPLVRELTPSPAPEEVFRRLSSMPGCVLFDTAKPGADTGRYSYVAASPFQRVVAEQGELQPLASLAAALKLYRAKSIEALPPFQGGAAGVLSYELGRTLEPTPRAKNDEFCFPHLSMGLYDVVIAFDHLAERCWIVSHGYPETTAATRHRRAQERMSEFLGRVEGPERSTSSALHDSRLIGGDLCPHYPVAGMPRLKSSFSREQYLDAVRQVIDYIYAGDVFQVNLSQRLLGEAQGSPISAYLALRERNPAPFAGYYDAGAWQLCSASPERFLSLRNGRVETRPIKGTRRRSSNAVEDQKIGQQLLSHPKDRAENTMIVDLLRNDLSRVCRPESVEVQSLCQLESYEHVHHLVSVVTGELLPGASAIDLLGASFPGGSITGAPKVRAMEIIAELEPTARGPYCGSLAFVGFNGAMDSSILIRSLTYAGGYVQAGVGGGIVADSDPEAEYQETMHKAAGLFDI